MINKCLYFAYGSNIHPVWFRHRVSSAKIIEKVQLTGWELCFHKVSKDNSAKCNIIKSGKPDASIYGVIYSINRKEKTGLDRLETGYLTDSFQINNYENVLVYRASEDCIDDNLLPYSWYMDIILSGAEYHRFPREYISFLQSFRSVPDPDPERESEKRIIIINK